MKTFLLAVIIFICTPGIYYSFGQNLLLSRPVPVFRSALGSETSYVIDHDLATGFQFHSLLISKKFNFNRIFYNKAVFGINEVLKNMINPFDFERLVMPYQSYIVLSKDLSRMALPQYLDVWQFVLIPSVIFIFIRAKYRKVLPFIFFALFLILIYGEIFLLLLIPFFAYGLSVFILEQRKMVKYFLLLIIFVNFFFSFNFFIKNKDWWMDQNIVMQQKILNVLVSKNLSDKNILITDRYGKLINLPKNINFGAFRFWEGKDKEEFYIGLPGEFLDGTNDETKLKNGEIIDRIKIPRPDPGGLGGEIWVVRKV